MTVVFASGLITYQTLIASTNDHAYSPLYIEFNNEYRNPLDLGTLSRIRDLQI